MTEIAPPAPIVVSPPARPRLGDRPPGDRYYRHPGDVVRLIVWAAVTVLLVLFIEVASGTSDGLRSDLGATATAVPLAARQLLLVLAQVGAVIVPATALGVLVWKRRWRRAGTVIAAAAAGAVAFILVDSLLDRPARIVGALGDESWLIVHRFPSPGYLAAAFAVVTVGKPWLSRRWRRAADVSIVGLAGSMAIAGTAGAPELLLALATGGAAGAAILVALGAPNRRPTPAAVVAALNSSGLAVAQLDSERAAGGRAQLYRAETASGPCFVKVYAQDSRDADLLYRSYRTLVLRDAGDGKPSATLTGDVEHEALLLLLAERGGVACPTVRALVPLADGSMALAMADIGGRRLDALPEEELSAGLLDAVWQQVATLHHAGLAHRSLRAANILVTADGHPVLIDLGFGTAAASGRAQAIDRAELLASLASLAGPEQTVASAARVIDSDELASAMPYLQPLALSASTRRAAPKAALRALRDLVAEESATAPPQLERLIRVRPRTLITVATLTGAFYILLPQLANVDDSVGALGSANYGWLAGAVAMSLCTYAAAGIALLGGVSQRLPLVTTTQVQLASSYVNRVTPANVGGLALNARYLQKAGVPPAEVVTGVGLNVIAGGVAHVVLLLLFLAWAGRSGASAFAIPSSSKLLVAIVVVFAIAGVVLATKWGRKLVRARVLPTMRQGRSSIAALARSPVRLLVVLGGSIAVTLAYTVALAFAVAAFDGGATFAQVGAVYLGAGLIAAAAPTPGGLGAMEAALVAGFTGIGMDPATAVAAVLSYRLVTFWLPILPGWLCFRLLDRRNYI